MKAFVRVTLTAVLLTLLISPTAFAGTRFEEDRDWASESPCGSISADSPCYVGSSTACPTPTSYETCMKACDCQHRKNLDKCGSNVTCANLAHSEKNACYGNCITDWA